MVPNLSDSRYLDVEFTGIYRCVRGIPLSIMISGKKGQDISALSKTEEAMTPKEVDQKARFRPGCHAVSHDIRGYN